MHISDNIKIVRALLKESQDDFRKRFTDITLGKQKSYEQAAANPGFLYINEIAELAGVSEQDFRTKKLTKEDIKFRKEAEEKDNKDKNVVRGTSGDHTVNEENDTKGTSMENLIASNRALADATLERAKRDKVREEADKIREEKEKMLVQSNLELAKIITTSNAAQDNPLANPSVISNLLDTLAELGTGSLWETKEAGLVILGNKLSLPGTEAKKMAGTHAGTGK